MFYFVFLSRLAILPRVGARCSGRCHIYIHVTIIKVLLGWHTMNGPQHDQFTLLSSFHCENSCISSAEQRVDNVIVTFLS
jgi:hypothetical protein